MIDNTYEKISTYVTLISIPISIATTICSLFAFISDDHKEAIFANYFTLIVSILFMLLSIYSHSVNRKIKNRYNSFRILAMNNKLHSLRLLLVLIDSKLVSRSIFTRGLHITSASFKYIVKPPDDQGVCDVEYHVNLSVKRTLRSAKIFRAYLIDEMSEQGRLKFINFHYPGGIYHKGAMMVNNKMFDVNEKYSSLYELTFAFPKNGLGVGKQINIGYDYIIKKEFDKRFGDDFFICPLNYGTKVDQFDAEIEFDETTDYSKDMVITLYGINIDQANSEYKDVGEFKFINEEGKNKFILDKTATSIKNIYFIHAYSLHESLKT